MKKQAVVLFAALILSVMTSVTASAQANWVTGHTGSVPPDAIVGGTEAYPDSRPFYVCHSKWQEGVYGVQPGKFRADFSGCDFGYAGQEIYAPQFEFLVSSWQDASWGYVPSNAVMGGEEPNGGALYYCRAAHQGSVQPGKIRVGLSGCNIPFRGKEIVKTYYQVLVALDPAMPLTQVAATTGTVPVGALRGGTDIGGQPLYMCVAPYNGGRHPGKLRREFGACNIPYGGAEISIPSYSVLIPDWHDTHDSNFWSLSFRTGTERNGANLYTCRDHFRGGIHPGKFRWDLGGCNFGWGGQEQHQTKGFDALTTIIPH